jgi:hypothetical protein
MASSGAYPAELAVTTGVGRTRVPLVPATVGAVEM